MQKVKYTADFYKKDNQIRQSQHDKTVGYMNGRMVRITKDGKLDRRYTYARPTKNRVIVSKGSGSVEFARKHKNCMGFLKGAVILIVISNLWMAWVNHYLKQEIVKMSEKRDALKSEVIQIIEEETELPEIVKFTGTASYYSKYGCIGCHPQQIMANGEPFIESALTLAFNRLPLGTFVEVKNTSTGDRVVAEVTDTGGFESLGRIADLSLGTKEAINCTDLCEVEISEIRP